jgi:hypothetical protein
LTLQTEITLYGQLDPWPSKHAMAALLRSASFDVYVGRYSIRLHDCEDFTLQEYGGDICDPQFDVGASSLDVMLRDAGRFSAALSAADIRHRLELYADDSDDMVGYFHHCWPEEPVA